MKRKSDELRPILKRTLEEELIKLEQEKGQEYYEIMLKNELFQFLPLEQQKELAKCSSGLALNVVGSVNCTLKKNKSPERALKYLGRIQESDGSLPISLYGDHIKRGIICKDGLSICLLGIVSNDYQIQKRGLSFFGALPENLDEQPYKDSYLEFCAQSTKEIMGIALDISRRKLEEESKERVDKKRNVSWVKRISPSQVTPSEPSSPTP